MRYPNLGSKRLAALVAEMTGEELEEVRRQLLAAGWSPTGYAMKRIENREAELQGRPPPHDVRGRDDLAPIVGKRR